MTLLIIFAGAIYAIILIRNLLNHKQSSREKYFDSQANQTRQSRIENNLPYYRGKNYQLYLASWTWKIISNHAMQAMKGKCEFCGDKAYAVHHIYYPKDRKDLGLEDISSLCVVCKRCHDVLHGQICDTGEMCKLCRKVKANKSFRIKYKKFENNRQKVCDRCCLIANGFRDEANSLSKEVYTLWVHAWQKDVLEKMKSQRGSKK